MRGAHSLGWTLHRHGKSSPFASFRCVVRFARPLRHAPTRWPHLASEDPSASQVPWWFVFEELAFFASEMSVGLLCRSKMRGAGINLPHRREVPASSAEPS